MCRRSPGHGHSYRLAGPLRGCRRPGDPARFRTFQTVECAKPVAPATKRGPRPVSHRRVQIASSSSAANRLGGRCGRLERSNRYDNESPRLLARLQPAMPPAVRCRRRHAEGGRGRLQRHPALDRADKRVAAGQSESWRYGATTSAPSFERRSGKTRSLEGGPDDYLTRSQPL
jgi:hypothetical protein